MKFKKLYLAVIVLGLIAAIGLSYQRIQVEKTYRTYELTMSFDNIKKTAAMSGRSIEDELKGWKQAGLNSVTLNEETLFSLKFNQDFKINIQSKGCDNVISGKKEGLDFIEKGFKETTIGNRKIDRISDTELIIEGKESDFVQTKKEGLKNKVEKIGLGYIQSDIDLIKKAGLKLRFRPTYISSEQDAKLAIDRFIDTVQKYSGQDYVVFQGVETFAAGEELAYLVKKFNENGISLGLIESVHQREHFEQLGLEEFAEALDYKAFRAFSTWDYIQKRYDYEIKGHHHGEEIMNAYFRAITERNIRVIYLKPFIKDKTTEVTDMKIYQARISELKERLAQAPHYLRDTSDDKSTIQIMPKINLRPLWQMLVAFSLVACFMLIVSNIVDIKTKYMNILLLLGILFSALIYLLQIKLSLFNSVCGLVSIILYVTLASQFIIMYSKKAYENSVIQSKFSVFFKSIVFLVLTILISLAGAVSEVAFYAESKYLLELGIFRGVKVSQMIPILIVFLLGLFYFAKIILNKEEMSNLEITKGILNLNVKVWHALAAGVVLLGMLILLLRSGNSSTRPSDIELLMRNLLENSLPARPRTKAFIIGYPSVIMLYYFASQKRLKIVYPLFAIFIAVGQANILNTFSHFRTPLYMSFMRVFFEFALASALTVVYIVLIELISKLFKKVQKKQSVSS